MKEVGGGHLRQVHIVRAKGIICAGTVQKAPVETGRVDDDGVGTGAVRADHALGQRGVAAANDIEDGAAKEVIADLAHQAGGDAQAMEGQPCVGDGAACGEGGRPNMDQLARLQEQARRKLAGVEGGDNVQTDLTGDNGRRWRRAHRALTGSVGRAVRLRLG